MTDQSTTLTPDARAANTESATRAANQANAVMGIHGITGVGKSGLVDTAIEYAWEEFRKVSLVYVADLGGFGNKRLSLIHAGICRVYDPRNHVNPFETMELISLGAWPETLIDPERGFAAPDVRLILPRRIVYVVNCPQGHEVARLDSQVGLATFSQPCPTCGIATGAANGKVDQVIVRHRMFRDVGMRAYDSMTSLGEWGMADLQAQSAKGTLPTTGSGGSLLGAADALVSGQFRFGSSSEGQYGFTQNRVYGWIANIRAIPDQVVPAIATFHTELSKESKRGAGDLHYGPKIPGQAGTAEVSKKLGNLLHAVREPFSKEDTRLVYRLYLNNHYNEYSGDKIPYVAKHRGTPDGMPQFLEDGFDSQGKPVAPWSGFSLKVFFRLLQSQLARLDAQRREEYKDASHQMWTGEDASASDEPIDEVVGAVNQPTAAASAVRLSGGAGARLRGRLGTSVQQTAGGSTASTLAPPTPPPAQGGGNAQALSPPPAATTAAPVPPPASVQQTAAAPSVTTAQGQASPPVTAGTSPPAPTSSAAQPQSPPPTPAAGVPVAGSRLRRTARPPV